MSGTEARVAVRTGDRIFPLIEGSAVWVPAGQTFALDLHERGEIRIVYLRDAPGAGRPGTACAVAVTPLVRELVARAIARGAFDGRIAAERRLALVLFDEVAALRPAPHSLPLPLPRGGPALFVAERLLAEPSLSLDTAALARLACCSPRTLERAFAAEVGIGVAAWRRRLRILTAIRLLTLGETVTGAAYEAGYSGVSAFIAAFRQETGLSPRRFLAGKE